VIRKVEEETLSCLHKLSSSFSLFLVWGRDVPRREGT